MELQHEPLGGDKQGAMWWYLDLGPLGQAGPSGEGSTYPFLPLLYVMACSGADPALESQAELQG